MPTRKPKVRVFTEGVKPPCFATEGAAGADLYLPGPPDLRYRFRPHELRQVALGISLELPKGWQAEIRPRSSSSKDGLLVFHGTIDSDYRGELALMVMALAGPVFRNGGERIAQLVFSKCERPDIVEVESLTETERGEGGFGSTGR